MNLRHGRREAPEINLTPLIDVVFLLLIFFMVSTTFEHDSELSIELPEAVTKTQPERKESIEVAIDRQGRYYVEGQRLVNTQLASVKQAILDAAEERESLPLTISADAETPHQAVVTVMDAARQLGFLHLTFATRLTPDEGVAVRREDDQ